jgi:hypothetical protein
MKIYRYLCLSGTLFISQLTLAKLPMPEQSLGQIEGVLNFCAQADPQAASKYQEVKKVLAGDATVQEVAEARKTQEYKDAYQEISDRSAKLPKENAVKACSDYLAGK